jgi:hypothetical protein
MGRAALKDAGLRWIEAAASEAAVAFIAQVDTTAAPRTLHPDDVVERMAPFAARREPPSGLEGVCVTAAAHMPTANTFFTRAVQREIMRALVREAGNDTVAGATDAVGAASAAEGAAVRVDYRGTPAWVALQDMAARRKKDANKRRRQSQKQRPRTVDISKDDGGSGGGVTTTIGEVIPKLPETSAAATAATAREGQEAKGQRKDKPAKKAPKVENSAANEKKRKKGTDSASPTESNTRKRCTTTEKEKPNAAPLSKTAAAVAREDDGNWRRGSKHQLASRIDRYVQHAGAMLALEREAEAASATAMLLQESESPWLFRENSANAPGAAEGTSVGRRGALMEGLQLVGTTAGPVAGTQLLDFRIVGGGVLPPSAINVGDRVAVAISPGGRNLANFGELDGVVGMEMTTGVDDDGSEGTAMSSNGNGGGGSSVPRRSYEVEGVVRVLDAAAGEVTVVIDPLHQRRLQSNVHENTSRSGDSSPPSASSSPLSWPSGDDDGYSLAQAADVVLAGRTLRLVRMPDVVTYERQLAALNTLRNIPGEGRGRMVCSLGPECVNTWCAPWDPNV